ncbi:MAG: ParM/StbA family protein, partial [Ruthenibacterium sp.]
MSRLYYPFTTLYNIPCPINRIGSKTKSTRYFEKENFIKIIAVDTGNKNIKTTKAPPFNAGLIYHGDQEPPVQIDTLEIDGKFYSLTETREPHNDDKTQNDTYFNLTLIAIAKQLMALNPDLPYYKENICLALGLPPSRLSIYRDRYYSYFSRNGKRISFHFNGIPFDIQIQKTCVFAQGISALVPYVQNIFAHARSYIVDIGGYTTDVIKLNNGKLDLALCQSLPYGAIQLFDKVRCAIRAKYQVEVDDYVIDSILQNKEHPEESIEKLAKDTAAKYAVDLFLTLKEIGVDLNF